ncbi:MAG: hypothetical protein ACM3ON_06900 [Chloroflexota bacterium]
MIRRFDIHDRVRHPAFGLGTIVDVENNDVVEVLFDIGGRRRLSLKYARLSLVTLEEEARMVEESQRFMDETFAYADGADDHGHGAHLAVITDDVTMFITKVLPAALKESNVVRCWGDDHVPFISLPPEEPKAVTAVWPTQYYGVIMLIRLNEESDTYECISAYPWFSEGTEHSVLLERVYPWHSRVEGQLSGTLRGMPVTFFDALYARHKAYYVSGRSYRFVLKGIAYSCEAVPSAAAEITDPDVIRILGGPDEGEESEQPLLRIETGGLAAFHPVEGWDRDDYHFQGPVRNVFETDFLGRKTWQVRVTIALSPEDDSPIDLDVYVTSKSLKGERTPQEGDELRGTLWLQGHLSHPESESGI